MGCRKNQATMSSTERTAFVNAVLALKTTVPSQMGLGNRYDDYVRIHMDSMAAGAGWAHRGPAFGPWHRELLRRFERDLQAVDPSVSLPYWDWTVNNSADPAAPGSPWTADFMGGDGDPGDDAKVTAGPFRAGNWHVGLVEGGGGPDYLQRDLAGALAPTLPTPANVTGCLAETPYDAAPWDRFVNPSFRDRLEGWHGAGSVHNRVHLWVGGSMLPSSSPNDPIFFLHHCNVDRLWAQWQREHPLEPYVPAAGTAGAPAGHRLTDPMQPWGGAATVASTLDHHAMGYWYDTDPPEVDLLTSSLAFTDIPEGIGGTGVTTYRAVRVEIRSCEPVTLQIVNGPTAPFTAPLGLSVTVPGNDLDPPAIGRVWIGFTSTVAGTSVTGSVTVRVAETGESWIVNLSANTVPRPKSAVALVLDRSGSMTADAGDGTQKIAKLREAVSIFVDTMLPGDGLGMVRFDHEVDRLLDVTDVGPIPALPGSGRAQAQAILAGADLTPRGATSVGGGVAEGRATLDTAPPAVPPYTVKAMVVLTDGNENTAPYIADVAASINASTFAIGFGTPDNVSAAALNALTQNHDGYLLVTGAIDADNRFRLIKYYLQILAGINNASVVLDPQGELVVGAVHRIPFQVSEADMGLDVHLLCPAPHLVDFRLETPGGQIIDPASAAAEPAIERVDIDGAAFYRLSLPALAGQAQDGHAGRWHAVLGIGGRGRRDPDLLAQRLKGRSLPYSLLVHAYSNLVFRAIAHQSGFEPGAVAQVLAHLREYDVPVEGRARVWAEVTRPDGVVVTLPLAERDGGQFEATLPTAQAGVYALRIRASGVTFHGRRFQREQTLTVVTFPGGDREPDPGRGREVLDWLRDRDERLCRLLLCLLDNGIRPDLRRRLEAEGLDVQAMLDCVRRACDHNGRREHAEAASDVGVSADPAPPLRHADVRRVLMDMLRAADAQPEDAGLADLVEGDAVVDVPRDHAHGPMFDLSPEDKAAGGHADGPDDHGGHGGGRTEDVPDAHEVERGAGDDGEGRPTDPVFDLSEEDRAAGGHDTGELT
jgi:hypothetical protein